MCPNGTRPIDTGSDPEIPGGVYLCQVDETVSCSACCGLYNVAGLSREFLSSMLDRRTRRFESMADRSLDGILAFRRWVENTEPQRRPFAEFHHCPYLGLIGPNRSRPGCLLHPMGNSGIDFRGISDYGGLACRSYFCPTHDILPPEVKRLVRDAARDWYEYGMIITESGLIQALLEAAGRMPPAPDAAAARRNPDAGMAVFREMMDLKCDWPYRPDPDGGRVHYFFNDRLHVRPPVDYAVIGAEPSPYDRIFRELGSGFQSVHELQEAETVLAELLRRMSSTLAPRIFRSFSSMRAVLADSSENV